MSQSLYQEQLLTAEWQSRRLEILRRDNYTCQKCGAKAANESLHVHHKGYVKDLSPWEYPDESLVTLCESCHKIEHKKVRHMFMSVQSLEYYLRSFAVCNCKSIEAEGLEWSGKKAHTLMLSRRVKVGCNYNFDDDRIWEFLPKFPKRPEDKYNYYAPGYYKVIYLYEDTIGAFYSAKDTNDFVAEEIILPRHSLDNSKLDDIRLGDVILIKRCDLRDYNRYEVDWLNWSRRKELEELVVELSRLRVRYDCAIDSNSQWSVEFHSGADRSSFEPPFPDEALNWMSSEIRRLEREIKYKTQELIRKQ